MKPIPVGVFPFRPLAGKLVPDGLDGFTGNGRPGLQDYLVPVGFTQEMGDFRFHAGGSAAAKDDPCN
jgi:hypothetical protein